MDFIKKHESLIQFIKFGLVGVSNSVIYYIVEMVFYYLVFDDTPISDRYKIMIVTAIAFVTSIINSYYWNNRYVFKSEIKRTARQHFVSFTRMALSYGLTGLVLSPIVKVWLNEAGIEYWAVSLCTLAAMLPINFMLNKLWAFKKSKKEESKQI